MAMANTDYSQSQPVGSTFVVAPAPADVPRTWEPLPDAVSACLGRPSLTLPPPASSGTCTVRNLQLGASGQGSAWGVAGQEVRPLMEANALVSKATFDEDYDDRGRSSCCGSWLGMCCCCCLAILALAAAAASSLVAVCRADYIEPYSQALSVLHRLGDDRSLGWWSLAPQPTSQLQQVQRSLYKQETRMLNGMNMSFGTALGRTAAELMYNSTRVNGVLERVPAKFHGVFRVQSQLFGEALATFQYSRWFDNEKLLVVPRAPMTWAWSAGTGVVGADGKEKGFMYDPGQAEELSAESILQTPTLSFKFSACPDGAKYCEEGGGALAFASVQVHPSGSLETVSNPGALLDAAHFESVPALQGLIKGTFALEELPGGIQPGSLWRQTSFWGVGSCECVELGSFSITKILDGKGEPLEPYYSAFAESAAGSPLYLWTGWPTAADREAASRRFEARVAATA